ncbi:MAG: phosphomannomutase, partial [Gammaproteobacteria bacterium]|nr:phosphomannomutase [Gammaproteobacteria bacterium]
MERASIFKAYDIRGRVPGELDAALARRIGWAFAEVMNPREVVIGRDVRPSSAALAAALAEGLRLAGVRVFDLGLCATEEVYFATFYRGLGGGIMVTASHNPPEYNGMKFVREEARPVGLESGLAAIAAIATGPRQLPGGRVRGTLRSDSVRPAYVKHVLGFVEPGAFEPLPVVVNAGHGCAGPLFDALAAMLPLKVTRLFHIPDGDFPQGVPNPLLPEHRAQTAEAVRHAGAALGIAWDGDADRCFLFDGEGNFIEGYYIVGLLAEAFLQKYPGAHIVHDPRLVWNTLDIVQRGRGVAAMSRCGHTFIKQAMRDHDAVYGGEMSAHHYFREFGYCDSGMLPWLLVAELISRTGVSLAELVA